MNEIIKIAKNKASQSSSKYKISATAFNKKGEVMATAINKLADHDTVYRGKHAEMEVLQKCRSNPHTILICRVNKKGDLLPIHPCSCCKKELHKRGVKILTVTPNSDILPC